MQKGRRRKCFTHTHIFCSVDPFPPKLEQPCLICQHINDIVTLVDSGNEWEFWFFQDSIWMLDFLGRAPWLLVRGEWIGMRLEIVLTRPRDLSGLWHVLLYLIIYLCVPTMCRAMSILHCECACTRYCHTQFLWQTAAAAVAGIAYILVGLLSHFLRTSTVFYVLFLRLFVRALCALHELYCSFCSDFERLL